MKRWVWKKKSTTNIKKRKEKKNKSPVLLIVRITNCNLQYHFRYISAISIYQWHAFNHRAPHGADLVYLSTNRTFWIHFIFSVSIPQHFFRFNPQQSYASQKSCSYFDFPLRKWQLLPPISSLSSSCFVLQCFSSLRKFNVLNFSIFSYSFPSLLFLIHLMCFVIKY